MHAENSPLPEPASPTPEPFCKNCGGTKAAHYPEERSWGEDFRCVPGRDSWYRPRIDPAASPPSSPTELTEALNALEENAFDRGAGPSSGPEARELFNRTYASRRAVESLVEARDKEIQRLRGRTVPVFSREDVLLIREVAEAMKYYDRHGDGNRDPALYDLADRVEASHKLFTDILNNAAVEAENRMDELAAVRSENERLRERLDGYAETEAMLCPEDWGFAEYVKHLEAKVEGLRQQSLSPELIERLEIVHESHGDVHGKLTHDCASWNNDPEDCNCKYREVNMQILALRALSSKGQDK